MGQNAEELFVFVSDLMKSKLEVALVTEKLYLLSASLSLNACDNNIKCNYI